MPRNEQVFPANEVDASAMPTPGRMRLIDERSSQGLNSSLGGTYSPENKIWIGGAGVAITGGEGDAVIDGVVETGRGAVGLVLAATRYPVRTHASSATRRLRIPITAANLQLPPDVSLTDFTGTKGLQYVRDPFGLKDTWLTWVERAFTVLLPQLRMHNGATLKRVSIAMRYERKPKTGSLSLGRAVTFARVVRWHTDGAYDDGEGGGTNDIDLYLIPEFQDSHAYSVGDVVLPTTPSGTPSLRRKFRVIVPGTSGTGSSGWNTTVGGTQVSGGVTFRVEPRPQLGSVLNYKEHYATLPFEATLVDTAIAHYNSGLPFELSFVPNNATLIDTDSGMYALEIITTGEVGATFHSVELELEVPSMKEP